MIVRVLVLLLLVLLSSTLSVAAEPEYGERSLVFRSNENGSPVQLTFSGIWIEEGLGIEISDKSSNRFVDFINDVATVNRSGPVEEVASLWDPSERERMKLRMSNKEAFMQNRRLYENIGVSWLYGVIEYGDYRICVVVHSLEGTEPFVKEYPTSVTDNDDLFLTNDLSGDYVFNRLVSGLANHYFDSRWKDAVEKRVE